jgi:hypothetical protein
MYRGLIQRIRGQSEPLSLHLEPTSPERTQLFAEASSKIANELNRSRIPPPDSQRSPVLLAARWISHDIYDEDMPGIAADLLEAGYDTPALVRLACEMDLYGAPEAYGLIKKAFEELGVLWPLSEMRAKLIATRQIAREVIAGERDPYRAASQIEIALWGWRAVTGDLGDLFSLNDELSWDAEHQRCISAILGDQLEVLHDLLVLRMSRFF